MSDYKFKELLKKNGSMKIKLTGFLCPFLILYFSFLQGNEALAQGKIIDQNKQIASFSEIEKININLTNAQINKNLAQLNKFLAKCTSFPDLASATTAQIQILKNIGQEIEGGAVFLVPAGSIAKFKFFAKKSLFFLSKMRFEIQRLKKNPKHSTNFALINLVNLIDLEKTMYLDHFGKFFFASQPSVFFEIEKSFKHQRLIFLEQIIQFFKDNKIPIPDSVYLLILSTNYNTFNWTVLDKIEQVSAKKLEFDKLNFSPKNNVYFEDKHNELLLKMNLISKEMNAEISFILKQDGFFLDGKTERKWHSFFMNLEQLDESVQDLEEIFNNWKKDSDSGNFDAKLDSGSTLILEIKKIVQSFFNEDLIKLKLASPLQIEGELLSEILDNEIGEVVDPEIRESLEIPEIPEVPEVQEVIAPELPEIATPELPKILEPAAEPVPEASVPVEREAKLDEPEEIKILEVSGEAEIVVPELPEIATTELPKIVEHEVGPVPEVPDTDEPKINISQLEEIKILEIPEESEIVSPEVTEITKVQAEKEIVEPELPQMVEADFAEIFEPEIKVPEPEIIIPKKIPVVVLPNLRDTQPAELEIKKEEAENVKPINEHNKQETNNENSNEDKKKTNGPRDNKNDSRKTANDNSNQKTENKARGRESRSFLNKFSIQNQFVPTPLPEAVAKTIKSFPEHPLPQEKVIIPISSFAALPQPKIIEPIPEKILPVISPAPQQVIQAEAFAKSLPAAEAPIVNTEVVQKSPQPQDEVSQKTAKPEEVELKTETKSDQSKKDIILQNLSEIKESVSDTALDLKNNVKSAFSGFKKKFKK